MHQILLLVACAAAAPQQRRLYGPQGRPQAPNQGPPALPSYTGNAPVYRDEMNFKREEVPVYREAEKNPEKRQAAYAPAPVYKEEKLPPQPFQYEYGVKDDYSGNAFAKTESQNDLGQVQGSYKVNLPDGRVQTVTYHADHEGGFVAEVGHPGLLQTGVTCPRCPTRACPSTPSPRRGGTVPTRAQA